MQDLKSSRRRFLKFLGTGSAAGAALAFPGAAYSLGIDHGKNESFTAFNFICQCNRSVIARVPDTVETVVSATCECGQEWNLRWEGDHFVTIGKEEAYALDRGNRKKKIQAFSDDADDGLSIPNRRV